MPRKKAPRTPAPDSQPDQTAAEASVPVPPKWDRVAYIHQMRERYPPVPVQIFKTPVGAFVETAHQFLHTVNEYIAAHGEDHWLHKVQLFDEANAILGRVGGLSLAARQVGYHLTNFDPAEVERRCHALQQACSEAWKAVTSDWRRDTEPNELYDRLSPAYDPFFNAINAVLELDIAVRPDLWATWPYRPKGEAQTVPADVAEWSLPVGVGELARIFGCHRNTVSKYLKHQKYPNEKWGKQYRLDLRFVPSEIRGRLSGAGK